MGVCVFGQCVCGLHIVLFIIEFMFVSGYMIVFVCVFVCSCVFVYVCVCVMCDCELCV